MRTFALVLLGLALAIVPNAAPAVSVGATDCSVDFRARNANLGCTLAIPGGQLTLDGSPVITTTVRGGERPAFTYDALGELVAADVGGQVTSYTYDGSGRLSAFADPSGDTAYTYDSLGRTVAAGGARFAYSDSGLLSRALRDDGGTVEYTYDSRGSPVRIDQDGVVGLFTVDAHGRVLRSETSGETIEYGYDGRQLARTVQGGETTQYSYDQRGNLVGATGPSGRTVYEYDSGGSLLRASGAAGITRFTYDRNGRLTAISGPDGGVTAFAYNDSGLPSAVVPDVGDEVVVSFEHADLNQPVMVGMLWSDAAGDSFSLTPRGRLSTCSACP